MRVIVQGRLKQRSYEDREGVKRTVFELDVEEVAASLKNATAKVTKTSSSSGGRQGQGQGRQQQSAGSGDPWGAAAQQAGQSAWAGSGDGGYSDEPPF
jgi:single-strand DNA-binding protein